MQFNDIFQTETHCNLSTIDFAESSVHGLRSAGLIAIQLCTHWLLSLYLVRAFSAGEKNEEGASFVKGIDQNLPIFH